MHAAPSSSGPRQKHHRAVGKNAAFMAANPSFALKASSSHHWFRNQLLETAICRTPANWLKAQSPFSSGEPRQRELHKKRRKGFLFLKFAVSGA